MNIWSGGWQWLFYITLNIHFISIFCLDSIVSKEKNPDYREKVLQIITIIFNQLHFDENNFQWDISGTKSLFWNL